MKKNHLLSLLLIVMLPLFMLVSIKVMESASFVDPNLEIAVRKALNRPEGGLRKMEVARLRKLDATDMGITELSGIENLKQLRVLNLEDNSVADVTPLKGLTYLEELSLRNNGITDLEAINFALLQDLPNLQVLSLRHNVVRPQSSPQVRVSDISILEGFTALVSLELRDNHIQDISPLANLTELEVLDISQNPLAAGDIIPLGGLKKLRELNLRETGVRDLFPLEELAGLTYLNIHSNPVESIAPLQNLQGLVTLIMRNVEVGEQIVYLKGLTRLNRLNIRNCNIEDISVLLHLIEQGAFQDNPDLEITAEIDIRDNPLPKEAQEKLRNTGSGLTCITMQVRPDPDVS